MSIQKLDLRSNIRHKILQNLKQYQIWTKMYLFHRLWLQTICKEWIRKTMTLIMKTWKMLLRMNLLGKFILLCEHSTHLYLIGRLKLELPVKDPKKLGIMQEDLEYLWQLIWLIHLEIKFAPPFLKKLSKNFMIYFKKAMFICFQMDKSRSLMDDFSDSKMITQSLLARTLKS